MKNKSWIQAILGLMLVMSLSAGMLAQNPPNRGRARGLTQTAEQVQQALQRGRQSRIENIKKQLASTDEEWNVLGPKIEKVLELNSDANAGLSAMARQLTPNDPQGAAVLQGLTGTSAMANKMQVLQQAIDDPATAESVVRVRLASARTERVRIHGELAKARAELMELLTQRQEAILFTLQVIE